MLVVDHVVAGGQCQWVDLVTTLDRCLAAFRSSDAITREIRFGDEDQARHLVVTVAGEHQSLVQRTLDDAHLSTDGLRSGSSSAAGTSFSLSRSSMRSPVPVPATTIARAHLW